ncbi:MAG: hypothetical protein GXX91_05910 [Verrucomicrobiaceae bacterium]|nr:hypothetical protein [Verrucomicrobiaceae bacterium]
MALLFLLVVLVVSISLDVGSIWGSARLVAHEPELPRSVRLWFKLLLLQIAVALLAGMIGGVLGALAENVQEATAQGASVGWILAVARIPVTSLVVMSHFQIGFLRSFAFLVIYSFLLGCGLFFFGAIVFLLMLYEPIGDAVLVNALLRPLDLI